MSLYFITGNRGKFEEVHEIIPGIKQLDIDLPEIQSLNSQEIISEKIKIAFKQKKGEFIVEDNSLFLDGMKGLPGPLIKWFLKTIGNDGIVKLSQQFGTRAHALVMLGYAKDKGDINYFESKIYGSIVSPKGDKGFGWDPIFEPDGASKTFGEMDLNEKNKFSMRRIAVDKLKKYLEVNK